MLLLFFFFNDTATTEIYTLSLHDALPIFSGEIGARLEAGGLPARVYGREKTPYSIWRKLQRKSLSFSDRKSTRLNSSHANISYAVFCLKKKTTTHHYVVVRLPTSPLRESL